jgi:outer membrane protein assembly factor BamA
LLGGSVTLALSRLVTGALAVSPENGFLASLTYRRREEVGTTRWSNELRGRLALYARVPGLGGFAHHVLAVRLAAGGTSGPLGASYSIGGVSSGTVGVIFGQSLGVSRTFPVRGYPNGTLSGQRAATGSIEYRLPLALIGRALGHLPIGADKLWLNAFADAGDAWAPGTSAQFTRLRSVGLELASRVSLSYDFLLALRLGLAQPLVAQPSGAARRPQLYFVLGSDF